MHTTATETRDELRNVVEDTTDADEKEWLQLERERAVTDYRPGANVGLDWIKHFWSQPISRIGQCVNGGRMFNDNPPFSVLTKPSRAEAKQFKARPITVQLHHPRPPVNVTLWRKVDHKDWEGIVAAREKQQERIRSKAVEMGMIVLEPVFPIAK